MIKYIVIYKDLEGIVHRDRVTLEKDYIKWAYQPFFGQILIYLFKVKHETSNFRSGNNLG